MNITNFYLPRNLDYQSLRDEYRLEYAEKLLFFISSIHFRRVTSGDLPPDGFVQLGSRFLGGFIRLNDVKRVKEDLIKWGIIETDNHYIKGEKCIGFRLTEQYRREKVHCVPALYPKTKSVDLETEETKQLKESEIMKYLEDNLKKLTIEPQALKLLENEFNKSVESYNYGFISYHLIKDKNWFFSADKNTGRVFHNVANLSKELRPFLRYGGASLAEVDVSNCQPMLLFSLYQGEQSAESERYKDIVENGRFYEAIQAITGQDRKTTKKRFMSFAFGKVEFENKVSKAFNILFPELARKINELKAADYKQLSNTLQKLEADLIIQAVIPLCAAKKIPVVTIHDSILTLPKFRGEVAAMIKAECERLYKLTPTLKTH